MAEKNTFNETVNSLFKGMDSFISSKTVVGDAIYLNDTIILPLVDVSFGVGAGAWAKQTGDMSSGGGLGGKITPSSVVVLKDGHAKLVNVKNQDTVTKVLDMVPDLIENFKKDKNEKKEMQEKVDSVVSDIE